VPPPPVVPVGALPPDGVVPPDAGVVPPLDGLVPPEDGVVAPLVPVVSEVLVCDLLVVVVVAVLEAIGWLGTVNGAAPEVFAVEVSPPPQAARPTPSAMASTTARMNLDRRAMG
jgi:hypothetical protein